MNCQNRLDVLRYRSPKQQSPGQQLPCTAHSIKLAVTSPSSGRRLTTHTERFPGHDAAGDDRSSRQGYEDDPSEVPGRTPLWTAQSVECLLRRQVGKLADDLACARGGGARAGVDLDVVLAVCVHHLIVCRRRSWRPVTTCAFFPRQFLEWAAHRDEGDVERSEKVEAVPETPGSDRTWSITMSLPAAAMPATARWNPARVLRSKAGRSPGARPRVFSAALIAPTASTAMWKWGGSSRLSRHLAMLVLPELDVPLSRMTRPGRCADMPSS